MAAANDRVYRRILVPLDQSAFSEFALPVAVDLARRWNAELRLVTVALPSSPPSFASQGMDLGPTLGADLPDPERPFPLSDVAASEAETYLESTAERLRTIAGSTEGRRLDVSSAVEAGDPAEALERHARECDADLIVMTTHARGPLTRVWLGSAADELVRRSTVPVLLVRPEHDAEPEFDGGRRFRHVLVPLEEWEGSLRAVEDAAAFATAFEARITLLHVEALPEGFSSPYIPHAAEERRKWSERERALEERLEELARRLRARGLDAETRVVVAREPSDGILDFAEAEGVDLIAMATRGRRGFDRLVRGSVSDEVTRAIEVPVLLHRTTEKEKGREKEKQEG